MAKASVFTPPQGDELEAVRKKTRAAIEKMVEGPAGKTARLVLLSVVLEETVGLSLDVAKEVRKEVEECAARAEAALRTGVVPAHLAYVPKVPVVLGVLDRKVTAARGAAAPLYATAVNVHDQVARELSGGESVVKVASEASQE